MNDHAIYVGKLNHHRFGPKPHGFSYRLYMLLLDLDQLDAVPNSMFFGKEVFRPLTYRREDYLGSAEKPLKTEVLDEVEKTLGIRPEGPVRLLTQVRSFGYVFNPVSFYYCYEKDGESLACVVAEITNTPWGERHRYVIPTQFHKTQLRFNKAFHVSPFFPMGQVYDWNFSEPGERLSVLMKSEQEGRKVFVAEMTLTRHPFSSTQLAKMAFTFPLMTWKVHAAIYFQALRLWLKKTPVFSHPSPANKPRTEGTL